MKSESGTQHEESSQNLAEPETQTDATSRQAEQLAILTLAIAFAAIGFAVSIAWIVAIVILTLLWGFQASALHSRRSDGGLVSALVTTAIHEARAVAEDASAAANNQTRSEARHRSLNDPAPHLGGDSAGDATKQELYQQAQDADIAGRSTMSKAELREALEG